MAKKKYNLKIVYNIDTDEITELKEEFSDLDSINFEIDGRIIKVPQELQDIIEEIHDDTLGLS